MYNPIIIIQLIKLSQFHTQFKQLSGSLHQINSTHTIIHATPHHTRSITSIHPRHANYAILMHYYYIMAYKGTMQRYKPIISLYSVLLTPARAFAIIPSQCASIRYTQIIFTLAFISFLVMLITVYRLIYYMPSLTL